MRHHTRVAAVASAAAAGLIVLATTACSGGGSASDGVSGTTAPVASDDAATSAPGEAVATDPRVLRAALLTAADIPVGDFTFDSFIDIENGSVCAFDFTDVMSPEMQATEVDAAFSSSSLMTILSESAWSGPEAKDLVATIAAEWTACSGTHPAVWSSSQVEVITGIMDMVVPGAEASVCSYFEMSTADGTWDVRGPMCIAASGDRVVSLLGILLDANVAMTPEEYQEVLATAAAKELGA